MSFEQDEHAEDAVFYALPDFRPVGPARDFDDYEDSGRAMGLIVCGAFLSLFWFAMGVVAAWYWP